ncbi:hypothetical protein EV127DRAFT_490479 [Xylaria flabelliformis]|nr:hypothetical protein EV127DRAFT_490479 [Xylaria flabelliformis]
MPSAANYPNGSTSRAWSFTPDHMHTTGFTHEPRRVRLNSRSAIHKPQYSEQHQQYLKDSWEELVESTPRQDAGVAEVRTWVLKVFHRRCHPDPERALNGFQWKGCDLHSQRRYIALRLRFRGEPYGYMIAHDIHDAVKESRKRARKQEKEAKRQIKQAKKTEKKSTSESQRTLIRRPSSRASTHVRFQDSAPTEDRKRAKKARKEQTVRVDSNRELDTHHLIEEAQPQTIEGSKSKARQKIEKMFAKSPRKTSPKITSSTTPWTGEENPFRDPSPSPRRVRARAKKKAKKKKKATASSESLNSTQDPFRDPSPMRLVDADDFRLENTD